MPVPAVADSPSDLPIDPDEITMVTRRMAPLQLLSFASDREYCGYLVRRPGDVLGFTEMVRGGPDGCTPPPPGANHVPLASIHTHGSYDATVPAEFPTALDMESDAREGVNGYVATPGGRLWFIDGDAMVAYQVCGSNCLPQDPDFRPGDDGVIAEIYSYQEILGLESPH